MSETLLPPTDALLTAARVHYDAREYGRVVELLSSVSRDRLFEQPELGFLLAASLRQRARPVQAMELARALEEPLERHGPARLRHRRLNLEGMLHFDGGAMDAAERVWLVLLEAATAADDQEYVAHACNNLGVVYTLAARTDEALTGYGRALAAYHRLGDRLGIAQANQNLGIVHRERDDRPRADEHFLAARDHAAAVGDTQLLGRVDVERSLLLLRDGDTEMAELIALRAATLLGEADDEAGLGEAERALGLIALATDRRDAALARLHAAGGRARAAGNALLEAETQLALALVGGAAADAEAALDRFDAMNARPWGEKLRIWMERRLIS